MAACCLYGQKCASKQFYCTLATWLCDNGFKQAKNEPCLFVNEAGVKVLLWVDDLLVRGLRVMHLRLGLNVERVLGSTCLMTTTLSTVG